MRVYVGGMRTQGSVRFDDYYKVQVWQEMSLAWKDVQKAWSTLAEAEAAMPVGVQCRIMVVTATGRYPLEPVLLP